MNALAGIALIGIALLGKRSGQLSSIIDRNDGMTDAELSKKCFRATWDDIHAEERARLSGTEHVRSAETEAFLRKCNHFGMLTDLIRGERSDLN
jgi:hypothetical protein